MGTYSEWDEEKRLEFLTRELKGKRPLVPLSIQVKCLLNLNNMIFFILLFFPFVLDALSLCLVPTYLHMRGSISVSSGGLIQLDPTI